MRKVPILLSMGLVGLLLAGCGHAPGGTPVGGGSSTAPVSLTMTDTPPSGVTVISFELSITGAVLQPGNVSLVSSGNPVPVELTQLQARNAFIGSVNVPIGAYNSLSLTFANPDLTILNDSGGLIGSCANGAVCELKPSLSPLTVTFSSTPFPITLTQNSPVGFRADVNLSNIIQTDLSVNLNAANGVTLTQLPAVSLTGELDRIDGVTGTVQSTGTNQFTLKTGGGMTFTIGTDSNTLFDFSAANCTTNNFSCIKTGQLLEVNLSLQGSGSFLATEVAFEESSGQELVVGTITHLGTSNGLTVMQLVVLGEVPSISNVAVGNIASVTIQNTASLFIDSGSFTLPGGLIFQGTSDLAVGQEVQVHVAGTVTTSPSISFATDRVALEPSELTATVSLIQGANFTINGLPSLFTGGIISPAAQILVQTTSQTKFDNLTPSSLAALATGNSVSVDGWVLSTPSGSTPLTIAAKEVRGRTISGP